MSQFCKEIRLSNGNTLEKEIEIQEQRLGSTVTSEKLTSNKIMLNSSSKLKKELFGSIYMDDVPYEVQEEFTRSELGISPLEWVKISHKERGKMIACEIIKGKMESIRRTHDYLEQNRKKALKGK